GIGTDGIKGDITEVEQPGEADHDVESQREQRVEDREVGDAHPARTRLREREGQQRERDRDERDADPGERFPLHARSPTRSPRIPEGLKTSTRIRTMKANTSW